MQQQRLRRRTERSGGQRRRRSRRPATPARARSNIAIELPQQGSELAASQPIINGIQLAIKEAGGAAGGYKIEIPKEVIFDDAKDGVHDPQTGAQNMGNIVGLDTVVAVIGPLNSSVAKVQIPISNEAGLLQCSPANTNEGLTKPEFGALDIRKANPTKINYVRVVTTDDNQGPAAAKYILEILGKKNVYIIDSTDTFGKGIADNFQKYLEGQRRTDRRSRRRPEGHLGLQRPDDRRRGREAGGDLLRWRHRRRRRAHPQGGGRGRHGRHPVHRPGRHLRRQRRDQGLVPEPGRRRRQELRTRRPPRSATSPAVRTSQQAFKAEYGTDPTGYSATGYACAQVVIDALNRAAAGGRHEDPSRERPRRGASTRPTSTPR